jgi:hypothetical protein
MFSVAFLLPIKRQTYIARSNWNNHAYELLSNIDLGQRAYSFSFVDEGVEWKVYQLVCNELLLDL